MMRHDPTAQNNEAPFSFEELFFSRTDERGIILSGNSVFQRISQYSWDELLKKPHNIIRHTDMPKAVFWLLWDTIKKGDPIGAYVKNRAKDGRYYWVYAIVTPIDGGFLSVRLKPSGPFFSVVEQEYAALAAAERRDGLKPAESAQLLLGRLAELGFKDYNAFMAAALAQVITSRDDQLGKGHDKSIGCFGELVTAAESLMKQADHIFEAYGKSQYVPLNLQVQAAQLGADGATIGVISSNYIIISDEIKQHLDSFLTSAKQVLSTITSGLFLTCVARIQGEVLEFFHQEGGAEEEANAQETGYLEQQRHIYQEKAATGLRAIVRQAEQFMQSCTEMKRMAAALEVTRVMGKVESARLNQEGSGLNELINDLYAFQQAIAEGLKEIENMNRHITNHITQLLPRKNG